ncbi:hypothetical protein SD340_002680 [Vibrio fluvialis]|nr:hypothetical protein [Vibrio fluvialis]ELU8400805.1 hypothetical protein [Vibrio fluvialis]
MESTVWRPENLSDELGVILGQFHACFTNQVSASLGSNDWRTSMHTVSNINIASVQKSALNCIEQIEIKLKNNAYSCLNSMEQSGPEINVLIDDVFRPGCIRSEIYQELNGVLSHLVSTSTCASEYLSVVQKHSGVGGLLRGLLKGYSDPVDGLSHAVGKGSLQAEVQTYQQKFQMNASLVTQSIDSITDNLKAVTLHKWNTGVELIVEKSKP